MENDGRSIIKECQNGNLEKFGLLYDAYINKIYRFIYYKTHHKETAEDLTSRTFMKALEKIKTFDADKGAFSTWLYQIARNNVIDFYRTKKSDIDINDVWDLSSSDNIERDAEMRQKIEKLESYLAKLPNEQREIIVLRVWEGLSHREISEIMGKSEAGCKMMYVRALKELRSRMPLELLICFLLLKI